MAKKQWEDEARDQFIAFLQNQTGMSYCTEAENVPVDNGKDFDYLLRPNNKNAPPIALELFRLTPNKAELAQNSVWIEIVRQLKVEFRKRNIKGYLIHTPRFFIAKTQRKNFVRDLAENISNAIASQLEVEQFEYNGYRISRISELDGIEFSSTGFGGAFDPTSIATDCLRNKIGYKNQQLHIERCKRIVLIVNWNPLVDSESVLLACSRFDFSPLKNIDEVYFETTQGHFHLVFDRTIYEAVEAETTEIAYFGKNLYRQLVEARIVDHDIHAFNVIKKITAQTKNINWFSQNVHYSLVMMAEDFLKKDDFDNALWIIRHLHEAQQPNTKSLLCWPLQKLALKNRIELYPEILDMLEEYSNDEDESVRINIPIPLAEMTARIKSKNPDGTQFMPKVIAHRIRALAFKMLADATGDIAERLSWVFRNIRDVSDREAWEIVRTLTANVDHERESTAVLIIYHAIYRERQFPELGPFDGTRLKEHLHDSLSHGNNGIRGTLVWLIWKNLNEEIKFEEVLTYLYSVTRGNFERSTFSHLYRIIADQLESGKPDACGLLLSALLKEREYLLEHPDEQIWHFTEFFDTILAAKKCCPDATFSEIREILMEVRDKLHCTTDYLRELDS